MAQRLPVGAVRTSYSPPYQSCSPSPTASDSSLPPIAQPNSPMTFHEQYFNSSGNLLTSSESSINQSQLAQSEGVPSEVKGRTKSRSKVEPLCGDGAEWVEQDEPGVYITLSTLPGGMRDLKRVRFRYAVQLTPCYA